MRVLVCPAMMEIGGSQLNAIELAAAVRDLGHDVVVYGPPGVLVERVLASGLEHVVAPRENAWPTRAGTAALRRLVRDRAIDVIHAYEWGPAVDAALGPHLVAGVPLVVTVLSMSVPDVVPREVPLVVGTADLVAGATGRRGPTLLMEPPIDTRSNAPGAEAQARAALGLQPDDVVLTVVGRLVDDLGKLPGVLDAIAVADQLADRGVRLVVAGGGPGLTAVRQAAEVVNDRRGHRVVVVTGPLLDPRDAYAAADVVLGMGSSALKGMAFGKPLVVQGAEGFWRRMDPTTVDEFLAQGWWGVGGRGRSDLLDALLPLLEDQGLRERLGAVGRALVQERFSLERASRWLVDLYERAVDERPSASRRVADVVATAGRVARLKLALARDGLVQRPAAEDAGSTAAQVVA